MSRTSGKKIMLWSSPRNISTALMYSFAQRSDTKVVDEPFYAYYLKHIAPEVNHPGKESILESLSSEMDEIVDSLEKEINQSVLFVKNMTHHLMQTPIDFSYEWLHIILTRHPDNAYNSFKKVISNPTLNDLGYKQQYELAMKLISSNIPYYLLSSEKLLQSPSSELQKLCNYLEIPFYDAMLSWNKGPIDEDGIWAQYWYKNVHNSEGFRPVTKSTSKHTAENKTIVLSRQYYHKLLSLKQEV